MKKILLALLVLLGLQIKAQVNWCDSISYTTSTTINYAITVSGNSANVPGTVSWTWQVCNATLCYSGSGPIANFNQVSLTDTLKVCYLATIDINGVVYTCNHCDTIVYNPNTYQWESVIAQPVGIKELIGGQMDGQMYDLLGREIFEVPKGTIYIKNRKKFIK